MDIEVAYVVSARVPGCAKTTDIGMRSSGSEPCAACLDRRSGLCYSTVYHAPHLSINVSNEGRSAALSYGGSVEKI